jgi:hypothetical protein
MSSQGRAESFTFCKGVLTLMSDRARRGGVACGAAAAGGDETGTCGCGCEEEEEEDGDDDDDDDACCDSEDGDWVAAAAAAATSTSMQSVDGCVQQWQRKGRTAAAVATLGRADCRGQRRAAAA